MYSPLTVERHLQTPGLCSHRKRANSSGVTRIRWTGAEAQLAVAEANQGRAQLDMDRYAPLARQQAITQQDRDIAIQNNLAAKARVQAAKAQVENDPLRDEGEAHAYKLDQAGVEVIATRYLGQIHDFGLLNALHNIPSTQESLRQASEALKKYLNQ